MGASSVPAREQGRQGPSASDGTGGGRRIDEASPFTIDREERPRFGAAFNWLWDCLTFQRRAADHARA